MTMGLDRSLKDLYVSKCGLDGAIIHIAHNFVEVTEMVTFQDILHIMANCVRCHQTVSRCTCRDVSFPFLLREETVTCPLPTPLKALAYLNQHMRR